MSLLRFDRCSRLQSFLLQQVYNTKEAYSIFRRLGLPESSVANKLPYYDRCIWQVASCPDAIYPIVMLYSDLQACTEHRAVHRTRCALPLRREHSALGEGGHARVTLTPWMNAALAADAAEPDTALRPKPRFRTHAPGFVEVVAANVALMWACATIKV